MKPKLPAISREYSGSSGELVLRDLNSGLTCLILSPQVLCFGGLILKKCNFLHLQMKYSGETWILNLFTSGTNRCIHIIYEVCQFWLCCSWTVLHNGRLPLSAAVLQLQQRISNTDSDPQDILTSQHPPGHSNYAELEWPHIYIYIYECYINVHPSL